MKFSTNILALIAISSDFANSLPNRIMKRDIGALFENDSNYLSIKPVFPVSKECSEAITKLNK